MSSCSNYSRSFYNTVVSPPWQRSYWGDLDSFCYAVIIAMREILQFMCILHYSDTGGGFVFWLRACVHLAACTVIKPPHVEDNLPTQHCPNRAPPAFWILALSNPAKPQIYTKYHRLNIPASGNLCVLCQVSCVADPFIQHIRWEHLLLR